MTARLFSIPAFRFAVDTAIGKWSRIATFGEKEKDGARMTFNADTLGEMVTNAERRGDPIAICADHASAYPETKDAPALGFFGALAVVAGGQVVKSWNGAPDASGLGDGLYGRLDQITPRGADPLHGLVNYKSLSPMFVTDGADEAGNAIGFNLFDVAATNTPFQSGCAIQFHSLASTDGLKARIAKALGWTVEQTNSVSLAALRDLVRPVDPSLAAEISDAIQKGNYIMGNDTPTADMKRVLRALVTGSGDSFIGYDQWAWMKLKGYVVDDGEGWKITDKGRAAVGMSANASEHGATTMAETDGILPGMWAKLEDGKWYEIIRPFANGVDVKTATGSVPVHIDHVRDVDRTPRGEKGSTIGWMSATPSEPHAMSGVSWDPNGRRWLEWQGQWHVEHYGPRNSYMLVDGYKSVDEFKSFDEAIRAAIQKGVAKETGAPAGARMSTTPSEPHAMGDGSPSMPGKKWQWHELNDWQKAASVAGARSFNDRSNPKTAEFDTERKARYFVDEYGAGEVKQLPNGAWQVTSQFSATPAAMSGANGGSMDPALMKKMGFAEGAAPGVAEKMAAYSKHAMGEASAAECKAMAEDLEKHEEPEAKAMAAKLHKMGDLFIEHKGEPEAMAAEPVEPHTASAEPGDKAEMKAMSATIRGLSAQIADLKREREERIAAENRQRDAEINAFADAAIAGGYPREDRDALVLMARTKRDAAERIAAPFIGKSGAHTTPPAYLFGRMTSPGAARSENGAGPDVRYVTMSAIGSEAKVAGGNWSEKVKALADSTDEAVKARVWAAAPEEFKADKRFHSFARYMGAESLLKREQPAAWQAARDAERVR